MSIITNTILDVDSYKAVHHMLYPSDTNYLYSYIESRGGDGPDTLFVGPQMFIKKYLLDPITQAQIDEAEDFFQNHGLPFNRLGWERIVDVHGGFLPLQIKAVKEGTRVSKSNVLSTIVNTDTHLPWLTSYIETAYLRACWYPTNVATTSYRVKQILRTYLQQTSDLTGEAFDMKLNFMLHDFGARGVSSKESAAIGGLGHLVNFMGTDTVSAVLQAREYYHEHMAGFSIPASEHSTVTSWGADRELDFYTQQLKVFGKPGKMFASVIDSYNADRAIRDYWGGILKQPLIDSGAVLVLRPDSGDPCVVVPRLLNVAGAAFGYTVNNKGYKVLPPYVRMIQGDGISLESIPLICQAIKAAGWSLENMAFGMGGALLQQNNRDTHKWAMKASAIHRRMGEPWNDKIPVPGNWYDVYKQPLDDATKRSKRGRFGLYQMNGKFVTGPAGHPNDLLETVYDTGKLMRDQTLAEIRQLAA